MTSEVETQQVVSFTAADRCDQCGAQAVATAFRAHALTLSELLLCGHHTNKNRAALIKEGWTVATS